MSSEELAVLWAGKPELAGRNVSSGRELPWLPPPLPPLPDEMSPFVLKPDAAALLRRLRITKKARTPASTANGAVGSTRARELRLGLSSCTRCNFGHMKACKFCTEIPLPKPPTTPPTMAPTGTEDDDEGSGGGVAACDLLLQVTFSMVVPDLKKSHCRGKWVMG